MSERKRTDWTVVQSPTDPEMYAVEGVYLVADDLPIEDARMIAAGPGMLTQLRKAEAFISGFEGDELQEGIAELLAGIRAAIAKTEGQS